ncbi:MAG TPA: PLP-dependent aminotransferase family protein [Candidatus Angelobacter sp.]|nr:PLP-dependent aminotransferase family protein [Candidatus Angelobacter sp.]
MKRVASGFTPIIALDRRAVKPLHRQIYDAYRGTIAGRNLRPGQKVPSTRELAVQLGISRVPVLSAYSQLLAEGYLESRSGSGTFVSSSMVDQVGSSEYDRQPPRVRSGPRPVSQRSGLIPPFNLAPWLSGWGAFTVGQPAFEHFPFQVWARLIARHSRNIRVSALTFSDPMGSPDFREAIAAYLRTARAVNCEAKQIMVVSGSQQAVEIAARVLLDPGNAVWIEEPGYRLARHVLLVAGARLVPVPVDHEGLNVAAGMEHCCSARAAYVTPSHQFPLGVTMSASRRLQLLEWAQRYGGWIIEDDYDSEYRYQDLPISSLQGLDKNSRVIYIGTFSKTLFPSLRLGYMVIPPDLIGRFLAIRHAMDVYPPHLYQAVLTDFINEGHLSRHIRRTRMVYGQRRNALVEAIKDNFGDQMEMEGAEAGMHLVVTAGNRLRDREISERAARENLWLWPLSPCYVDRNRKQGFILGFGSTDAREIPKRVSQLRRVMASAWISAR